jgi:hypothetical protein
MSSSIDYAKTLRVIGQVLDSFRAKAYDIVCYGNCYLVRCQTQEKERLIKALPNFLRLWREEPQREVTLAEGQRSPMNVELIYSLKEVETLDDQGKARRRDPRGMPNPHSLSNMLRCVGRTLNAKRCPRLLLASNHDHTVVIIYQNSNGTRRVEEHPVTELYDTWVQTYLKRKEAFQAAG